MAAASSSSGSTGSAYGGSRNTTSKRCGGAAAKQRGRVLAHDPRLRAEGLGLGVRAPATSRDPARRTTPRPHRATGLRSRARPCPHRDRAQRAPATCRVQPIEQCLAHAVGRRPHRGPVRNRDPPAAPFARDDPDAAGRRAPNVAALGHVRNTNRRIHPHIGRSVSTRGRGFADGARARRLFRKAQSALEPRHRLAQVGFARPRQRPLDEATIEELETRLLTADVGVDATAVAARRDAHGHRARRDAAGGLRLLAHDRTRAAADGRGAARHRRVATSRS